MGHLHYLAVSIAQLLSNSGDHHLSNEILKNYSPPKHLYAQYHYLRSVNHFKLNERDQAAGSISNILDSFGREMPERYLALAEIMKNDIAEWKKGNEADIARKMSISGDRLQNRRTDERTQKIQKEILSDLDKLIKESENLAKGLNADGSQAKPSSVPGQAKPMDESFPSDLLGGGKVDEKELRNLQENWGKMPEKERARAIVSLTRDFPAKYRVVIEEYFKTLSRVPK